MLMCAQHRKMTFATARSAAKTAGRECDRNDPCDAEKLCRIEEALSRIETGEFGYCTDCGEPIALAKLMADPSASSCARCG